MQKKINIDPKLISSFSLFLKNQFGLSFPKEKYLDLERELIKIMPILHETDPFSCIQKLTTLPLSKLQIEIITSHFTIGETYFFREPEYFHVLKKLLQTEFIIPRQHNGQWLRIWSAGCSSGEEAYSIAILVADLIPNIKDWNILILATDINLNALDKVKKGVYGEWSFRNVAQDVKEKYFTRVSKNAYEIKPFYKKLVKVNYHNLVQDDYPSLVNNTNAMDIIFCRNLLMYFDAEIAQNILQKLSKSLINDGYLVVSSSEHSLVSKSLYCGRKINNSIFYHKNKGEESDIHAPEAKYIGLDNTHTIGKDSANETMPKKEILNIMPTETKKYSLNTYSINTKSEKIESVARKLANAGKLQEALLVIEEGIKQDKCHVILHYLKALVLGELNLLDEAISELNKIIYLDPNFVLAYFTLGNIAVTQERRQAARKYYSIVLALTNLYDENDILPGSEGSLTAASIRDIIHSKKFMY